MDPYEDDIEVGQEQEKASDMTVVHESEEQGQLFQSLVSFGKKMIPPSRRPLPSSSDERGDLEDKRSWGRGMNPSSRSRSRSRSRSSDSRDSSSDTNRSPFPYAAAVATKDLFSGDGAVLDDSDDVTEQNEMDTQEYFTEGVRQERGKKLKVEKERGMTSLEAAAARRSAPTEENEFVDDLMDMQDFDSSSL